MAGLSDSTYQRPLKERIVWLGGEMRDENASAIYAQILLLTAEGTKRDIYLYVDSPDGSVTADVTIYDTVQYTEPDIVTVGMNLTALVGQFLLTAGTPSKHCITSYTHALLHQPLDKAEGSVTEIRINTNLILKTEKGPAEITA